MEMVRRRLLAGFARIVSRENVAAFLLCLLLIFLLIVTSDSTPRWIYQGF
jgi:hypothetical protein